jgi:rhodanese-related sulfurtransferase
MGLFGLGRKPAVEDLSIDAIKQGIAEGSIMVVDVREPHEWAAGHIPGSVLAPLSSFDPLALPPLGDRRLVLSCRSGKRSLTAAAAVQKAGLVADAHYAGGFLDWVAHGEPVETGD